MLADAPRLQRVHEGVQVLRGADGAHAAVPDLHADEAALPGHAPPVAPVLPVPAQGLPSYAAVLQRPLKLLLPPALASWSQRRAAKRARAVFDESCLDGTAS